MTGWAVQGLRVVLAAGLAGAVFVQLVMVPLLFLDLDEAPTSVRVPVVVFVLRAVLAQAIARDDEARGLQAELDQVI